MKLALIMVCSLLLAGTPFLPSQTVPSCTSLPIRACCHGGGAMNCCATQPASGSQPVPTVPPNSGSQKQFSVSTPAMATGTLPSNEARSIASITLSPLTAIGVPLYARDCARLI